VHSQCWVNPRRRVPTSDGKYPVHTCIFQLPTVLHPLMKNMYTVGVLVHGVHHTLPVSQHRLTVRK